MFPHRVKSSKQLLAANGKVLASFFFLQREFNNRGITLPSNEYIKAGEQ